MTENIERRFKEHQNGNVKSTRRRRPFELIYKEAFITKKEAETRERFFKTGKGREYLKGLNM